MAPILTLDGVPFVQIGRTVSSAGSRLAAADKTEGFRSRTPKRPGQAPLVTHTHSVDGGSVTGALGDIIAADADGGPKHVSAAAEVRSVPTRIASVRPVNRIWKLHFSNKINELRINFDDI